MPEETPEHTEAVKGLINSLKEDPLTPKTVFESAKSVLEHDPADVEAILCKAMAQMDRNQPDQAIEIMKTLPKDEQSKQFLMKAYLIYKKTWYEKVLTMLSGRDELGARYLRAQSLYKLGRFEEAEKEYASLLEVENTEVDFLDTLTNLTACQVSRGGALDRVLEAKKLFDMQEDTNTEIPYNLSLALMREGNFQEAEALLRRIRPDLDESDLFDVDLAIAYCLQFHRKNKEAKQKLLSLSFKVKGSRKTALRNNLFSLTIDEHRTHIYDALYLLNGLEKKRHADLLPYQRRVLLMNRALLLLMAKKNFSCFALAKDLRHKDPTNEESCLILAGYWMRAKKLNKSKDILMEHLAKNPGASVNPRLALAQLHLRQGNRQGAISGLQSLTKLSNSPAVLATLAALYQKQGTPEKVIEPLTKAIQFWATKDCTIQSMLQMKLAELHMEISQPAKAAEIYQDMLKSKQHDLTLRARLSIAQTSIDPKLGKEALSSIPLPQDLHDLDPEDLLEEMIETPNSRICGDIDLDLDLIQEGIRARRRAKRKRRPPRLPKGVTEPDPNYVPDPNRWLPKKKRRKNWQKNTAAQGGETKRTDSLNIENVERKRRRKRG